MTSLTDINRQIAKLQKQAEAIKSRGKKQVLAGLRATIAEYGITAAELGFDDSGTLAVRRRGRPPASGAGPRPAAARKTAGRSSGKSGKSGKSGEGAEARYRDADGNSWSGRGKRPNWFKAALAAGKSPEDLLVKSEAVAPAQAGAAAGE